MGKIFAAILAGVINGAMLAAVVAGGMYLGLRLYKSFPGPGGAT